MHNCIFTPHCTEITCDRSCPILVETSYLLERNGISMQSEVFKNPPDKWNISAATEIIRSAEGGCKVVTTPNTVQVAEFLTYCAVCQNWQGSRLHCNVYNLKYSTYIDSIKKSWTSKSEPEELEYMRIWANSAKVLIISNIDFVNFGDFESQTLLSMLQSRRDVFKSTIIVGPKLTSLVGKGEFFKLLQATLGKVVK